MKTYYIYIIASENETLYIWVTSNLIKRIYEHKNKTFDWFSKKYNITKLVYYEIYNNSIESINREKQLKKWNREWKINLINENNPLWKDLYEDIIK
ncbi:MAG: hypothetical protein ACD_49C00017G0001 [uncultured bacterium (gcode 4)]|uniref:GIY-YIG domain-containing protein n=1 Tax=uncultured bacterium (gcode 4) TaxID=1234023 RepID=K2BX22_9BACT|nr:MAG: hypothetical protein ACD_49C00017G0001 [uncultured bacterium (gcode 4)]